MQNRIKSDTTYDKRPHHKVVFMGESGAGKTSLIRRLLDDVFHAETSMTVGGSFYSHSNTGRRYVLDIWDTAGQERYHSIMPLYYRGASLAVIGFDVGDRGSFETARMWMDKMMDEYPEMKIVFVGNKIDVGGNERVIQRMEGELCVLNMDGIKYVETSAKTGLGINRLYETMLELLDEVEKRRELELKIARGEETSSRRIRLSHDALLKRKRRCCR